MAESCYCQVCRRTMAENKFYTSNNIEKFPPKGKLPTCKACLTLCVNNWDPATFLPILEQIDVPYIKEEWDKVLTKVIEGKKPEDISGMTVIGKYLAKMKLVQWRNYRWADSERIQQEIDAKKRAVMKAANVEEEEIERIIEQDHNATVPTPQGVKFFNSKPEEPELEQEEEFEDTLDLTDEDRTYLRLKWGKDYRPEEWVAMEQLYIDMENSYDIQTAGHRDTLKLICKTSLKANQMIDCGDYDGYQKLSKTYDMLMKSGNFTAAQNKASEGEFIDSISELVAVCEKQGFIPEYYVDKPMDKVDRTIQDLQNYTRTLVQDEMGLGDKIESAAKQLMEARENEYRIDDDNVDSNESFEESLFSDDPLKALKDEDFEEFNRMEEENEKADEEYLNSLLESGEL